MSSLSLPLLVSQKISIEDVQNDLKLLMDRMATMPADGGGMFSQLNRKLLQKQIDAKRAQLTDLTGNNGVPPAPDKAAILGPRIETPKVGFNDLKIFLPPR